jgi:hypothetical protein
MSNLKSIVYNIRNTVFGAIDSTDNILSDAQIAYWVNLERAALITQDINANKHIPEIYIQKLGCLPLECVKLENFGLSISMSGEYLRTPKLPTPISYRFPLDGTTEAFIYVGLIDDFTTIELVNPAMAKLKSRRKYTGTMRYAFYQDNYIYIANGDGIETITVRGIFEDPNEVGGYISCDGTVCFNDESPYPITQYHENIVSIKVIETRIKPYLLNRDSLNNANEPDVITKQQQ